MFRVFSITQFRWLFLGNAAFFFAMQGQMLTRTLLAWDLTGQATSLAYVNLVVAIPMIFASVAGGAITDRVERRRLVIIGQCIIAANDMFLLALLFTDQLQFWHMLCTAFMAGCAFPFIMPARMAITMKVVGPALLQSAMAFSSGVMNLNRVLGPAAMGLIIAASSYTTAYVLSVMLYLVAIACMFGISPSWSDETGAEKKPLLADIKQGFSYILNNRPVLITLFFGLLPMFLAMPFQSILVVLVDEMWQTGETGVGTMMAIGGVGGVIGAIWVAKRGDNAGRVSLMVGATLAFGFFLGLITQTPNFYLALVPLLLANVFVNAGQTINNASVQLLVEDKMRGRISSFMMLSFALTPIGVFPIAMAADRFGASNAILGAAILLVVLVGVFYALSPTLRGLDQSINDKIRAASAAKAEQQAA